MTINLRGLVTEVKNSANGHSVATVSVYNANSQKPAYTLPFEYPKDYCPTVGTMLRIEVHHDAN